MSSAHLKNTSHHIFSKLSLPKTTKIYDTYWRFAAERQEIFFKRIAGAKWPWTNDPILKEYKFTNAYRASDRVSQYLIRNVIYQGDQNPEEVFFRILLFKLFNKIETWQLFQQELGKISYSEYSFKVYNNILTRAFKAKKRIYSAAYIMASGRSKFGFNRKHANHLKLIELMMRDSIPERITELKSLQALFELLRSYPTLGDFLAYQYAIDLNYSNLTNFSEMEFIIPQGRWMEFKSALQILGHTHHLTLFDWSLNIKMKRLKKEESSLNLFGVDCYNLLIVKIFFVRLTNIQELHIQMLKELVVGQELNKDIK